MQVLYVEDDAFVRRTCASYLQAAWSGAVVQAVGCFDAGNAALDRALPDVLVADLRLPPRPGALLGLQLVRRAARERRKTVVLTGLAADAREEVARAGASLLLEKPATPAMLRDAGRLLGLQVTSPDPDDPVARQLVGRSRVMQDLRAALRLAALDDAPVLLLGPTGAGKGAAARALHDCSGRRGDFVHVNCATFAGELLENEMFGHVHGAFTGARERHLGAVARAADGTLFLDEIAELTLPQQAKLLTLLDGAYRPLGATRDQRCDARVVFATNADLEQLVRAGRLREDLFWRLHGGTTLRIPPLAERIGDLPDLVSSMLAAQGSAKQLTPDALALLLQGAWAGNVRQLSTVVRRIAHDLGEDEVDPAALVRMDVPAMMTALGPLPSPEPAAPAALAKCRSLEEEVAETERRCIERALASQRGNRARAADRLGLERNGLLRRMKKHGIV